MSDKTGIQWTDATWNPCIGCAKVSEGCRNCYAMSAASRIVSMSRGRNARSYRDAGVSDGIDWGAEPCSSPYEKVIKTDERGYPEAKWNGRAVFLPERLDQPLRWQKPRMVFVNSMSDLFHEDLTFEQIAAIFGVMAASPRHTFQVLTKRPARMLEFFEWMESATYYDNTGPAAGMMDVLTQFNGRLGSFDEHDNGERLSAALWDPGWPLPNVWLGVSVEDQATADDRIPVLLQCPAAVRWVSAEPLIGPVDDFVTHYESCGRCGGTGRTGPEVCWECCGIGDDVGKEFTLDWVVVGGESGNGARPCHLAWIRSIVDQCHQAEVPCFVKQLGAVPTIAPSESVLNAPGLLKLKDRKGGNPDEWPADLRVRQWPEVTS